MADRRLQPYSKRSSKKGRKGQDSAARSPVRITRMLRAPGNLEAEDTAGRLRRGLSPTQGPRTVDVMAREACFSRRQFHRLTLRTLGETPGAHQRRLRLDRAAWLLLTSRANILEIALETGWESHETFTRAFRARFGVTPSAFRKDRGGHVATIDARCAFHRNDTRRSIRPAQDSAAPRLQLCLRKHLKPSITAATHRLTLEIAKPHAAVWKAFTNDVHSWWPKDFYATESTASHGL